MARQRQHRRPRHKQRELRHNGLQRLRPRPALLAIVVNLQPKVAAAQIVLHDAKQPGPQSQQHQQVPFKQRAMSFVAGLSKVLNQKGSSFTDLAQLSADEGCQGSS